MGDDDKNARSLRRKITCSFTRWKNNSNFLLYVVPCMAFECGHHSDCRIHSRPSFKVGEPAPNLARKPNNSHVDTFIERNGEGRKEARKGVVLASPSLAVAQGFHIKMEGDLRLQNGVKVEFLDSSLRQQNSYLLPNSSLHSPKHLVNSHYCQ